MKIRTILGLLLIIALVVSSTGVAAAKDQDRECWVPVNDDVEVPPTWAEDGNYFNPGGKVPPWLDIPQ